MTISKNFQAIHSILILQIEQHDNDQDVLLLLGKMQSTCESVKRKNMRGEQFTKGIADHTIYIQLQRTLLLAAYSISVMWCSSGILFSYF